MPIPQLLGRYRVERVLGKGGFGAVYLAHDEQLQRPVAIKVPHPALVDRPETAETYLTEARTVAHLDHPQIVPVYDVGCTKEVPFFIVSKYIDGTDLATRQKQSRLSLAEAVGLVATIADALHHAHKQGLVHRDIKPANILLDREGKPFLADFGLALWEQDFGKTPCYAGTPAYMSPEQARGEGHRVDGRSDLFSLGVVLYELLVGRRPFRSDSLAELLDQITRVEPKPPRQINDGIPRELDRICLKVLSKRSSERYSTASDMADDLRQFLAEAPSGRGPALFPQTQSETGVATPPTPQAGNSQAVVIVPKGLRSFEAADADFFLELLPGPRGRDGLPDSIRFWKSRIESTPVALPFAVGVIYGPSGCGKSSLIKAGLLPRLANSVRAVYVEATGEETEARLLRGLRLRLPELPENLGLIEALAGLRRGKYLEPGNKVLLVLDQFEQWLHTGHGDSATELVQALRQCDGARVQCIVMVRDDFWLAVSRFMQALEVRLAEGENSRLVDLFDLRHARKILAAFGRAFGCLPESGRSQEQDAFLDQAVADLSQDGKVVCVRLALFAEMVKAKPWTPATLREVGGAAGVGVAFLEETFTASTAPPPHRVHQKGAREVLKSLLPDATTDIKGHMRSYQELLEASGYAGRARDFEALLQILDKELHLITPTDPEGSADAAPSSTGPAGARYYQLTHDYLVPSLRDWLTRKQKETRRGRAELLLADLAAMWAARPQNRQLPSFGQWLQITWLTQKKHWGPTQRKMMGRAGRHHGMRGAVAAVLLAAAAVVGLVVRGHYTEQQRATNAAFLVQSLLNADTPQVPAIVAEMAAYRKWVDPALINEYDEAPANSRRKLHASLALLSVDSTQVDYLYQQLLDAEPRDVPVISDALASHQDALRDRLWAVVQSPDREKGSQRLRAAAALAKYDPRAEQWEAHGGLVAQDLVAENPVFLGQWTEAFRPVKNSLLGPLSEFYRDRRPERIAERGLAANLLADYASDRMALLADLLMDADEKQFPIIYAPFKAQGERGLSALADEIDRTSPPDAGEEAREKLAKRQANAAVVLLRMNRPANVWPVLKHSPDPRTRSYLIHCLGPLGADGGAIIRHLDEEPDVTIRRALVLSLGEFGEKGLPLDVRNAALPRFQEIYRHEADPGLHGATEWLLRQWKQGEWLKRINEEWARDKDLQDRHLADIQTALAGGKEQPPPRWYVNSQGQTMVVLPGPAEFLMGSPPTEVGRSEGETQHRRRIGRTFALAATTVTVEQYQRFHKEYRPASTEYTRMPDLPAVSINWYMAAAYCNWLSKEEDIPEAEWCYEIEGPNTRLKANYLSLSGYRMPTEAEVEYATRAGAATARYHGETEELLAEYAWYNNNSQGMTWPVASLKPNDFGLFGTYGNVYQWCQERYTPYPNVREGEVIEDREDQLEIPGTVNRVVRGRAYHLYGSLIRSAGRYASRPDANYTTAGFRVARTIPPAR